MIGTINGYSTGYGVHTNYNLPVDKVSAIGKNDPTDTQALEKLSKTQCETCKSRKYVDGSNEMVSFKSPAHIAPSASGSVVRAHEQEHVSNAYSNAAKNNGQVIRANVSLQTSVCPECGTSYVSGGLTTTQIKYQEDNPYSANQKSAHQTFLLGMNIDERL